MSIRKLERQERRRRRQIVSQLREVNALIERLEDRQAPPPTGAMTAAKWSALALVAFLGVLVAFACLPRFVVYFLSL